VSVCSLNTMRVGARAGNRASLALRLLSGGGRRLNREGGLSGVESPVIRAVGLLEYFPMVGPIRAGTNYPPAGAH
jgi:hypothetical protein